MTEASMTYRQTMLPGFDECISSPGSGAGITPCVSPVGQKRGIAGQDHAPASHSAPPASEREPTTNGTCGRSSDASLRSASLQSRLASKLRARMDVNGSPEFVLTWKSWDMESGPPICALRGRARRASDSAFGGWPTPAVTNADGGPNPKGNDGHRFTLQTAAVMAAWPTTRNTDGEKGIRSPEGAIAEFDRKGTVADLPTVASLAGWTSPRASEIGRQRTPEAIAKAKLKGGSAALEDQVHLASWATPATRDYRYPNAASYQERSNSTKGEQLNNQVVHHGPISPSSPASTVRTGVLNPAHSRWLQGYPQGSQTIGWDSCSPNWQSWVMVQKMLGAY